MTHDPHRQSIVFGTQSEALLGFSRAVRVGSHIHVSGTTASPPSEPDDWTPADEARAVADRIIGLLAQAGAEPVDVVRTRIYVTDMAIFPDVAQVHGDVFGAAAPATTVVQVLALADPRLRIEIEAEAYVPMDGHERGRNRGSDIS